MKATVVIPVYNQLERLIVTLKALNKQNVTGKGCFDVVVIDDGSLSSVEEGLRDMEFDYDLKIATQENKGRSIARNMGVEKSNNDIVIFCDADRVPGKEFVRSHIECHEKLSKAVVIGYIREVYISNINNTITDGFANDPDYMLRRSRVPAYPRMVYSIYNNAGETDSGIPWISTFSGNMSLPRDLFLQVGGFSEEFDEWGFEHFELGYRLFKNNVPFHLANSALNYHIAHLRNLDLLNEYMNKSIKIMSQLHPHDDAILMLGEFMSGKITLQKFETNNNAVWVRDLKEPLSFSVGML